MKKLTILILSMMFLQVNAQITSYNINSTITCTDTIQPFGTHTISYGLSIDGEGQLLSDTAFIRVVLVDKNDNEWLVYERNSLYSTEENYQFQNAAFETAALYKIEPSSIIVTLCDATLYLSNIKSNGTVVDRNVVKFVSDSSFLANNLQIVDRINAKLAAHKKAWRADTTFLSNLRYRSKKALFGNELPNLEGWDYYAYGYYSPLNDNTPPASDNIVKEFDWRTRHGSQNSGTYYYNQEGSGWIPRWRYGQDAENYDCWAFSVLYSTESMVNLYFNQQINNELSVQDILSCSGGSSGGTSGGVTSVALDYVTQEGVVNESCLIYMPWYEVPCDWKCSFPDEIVSIGGYSIEFCGEEEVKRQLITKGTLVGRVKRWHHAMSMVGFGVVKVGDPILYGNFNAGTDHDFVVEEDSPDIGKPYYIFKQSYATYGYDESHFCKIIINANNSAYMTCYSIDTPITSMLYNNSDIDCADNDGDGYYNWGIGPKPATCPNCPDEEDCDDSSPLIGPYDEKYECRILCENYVYSSTPEYITGETLWGSETYIDHDVIVENGGVLTIENTVFMGEYTKIIVKPGGKLVLDYRAVLTGLCGSMWQGIEVWGNKNAHQYEVNGSYQQGYVELKNGATIENAVCALELWRPDYWSTTGGIVHAEDAVFRNNQRSVHALYYKNQNYINGKETDYNAWFKRCRFIVDDGYLGDEDHVFHKHVDLDHVRGLKFQACDFSVTGSSDNISYWTSGIAGYEAGFSVSGQCENNNIYPCPSYDNSTFSGFLSAISALNDGTRTPPTITVTHSSFSNNDFGIYVNNLSNVSVRFCDFDVKRQDNWLCGAGIFLENAYSYSIEENALSKINTFNGDGIGIIIKDCAVQSKIYRNGFENLHCGNLAWGRNILMKSSNNYIGLEYGCNTNTGNVIDFYVLGEDGVFSGIQSSQGSSLAAARNTFSNNGYHFFNDGDHRITYYYYDATEFEDEQPLRYNASKVQIHSTTQTDGCPSSFGVDPVSHVLTPAERQQREQEYYDAYTAYNSLKSVYDSHIDGGSTDGMMNDIASATSSDMWTLRARLLGASPYLTSPVLTATSDRDDVFTESVLFEILLSNPDELKKDSLMDHLRNKANPLPQYMMDILDQVANGSSARTVMQNRLSAYRGTYTRAAGDIVRSLVNDTAVDLTELRGWLSNMGDIHADRDIIATYVDEGDFTSALSLANMLPTLYGLVGNDLTEHDDYVELLELYRDLYADGRNTMQFDSTERAQVERIAHYGTGYPQSMAQAILHGTDWESYSDNPFDCPTLTLPEGDRGGKAGGYTFTQEDLSKAMGMSINVKPNPASTWTAVDFILPADATKATINVTNALGIAVFSSELNGNQGQKVLDLRHLSDGVYVYTVQCGEYVQTGKLVITK